MKIREHCGMEATAAAEANHLLIVWMQSLHMHCSKEGPQLHVLIMCVPAGAFEEALRGAYAEGDVYKETITWPKIKVLLRIPSNWLIIFQVGNDVLHCTWKWCGAKHSKLTALSAICPCPLCGGTPVFGHPDASPGFAGPAWFPALGHDAHLLHRLPVSQQGVLSAGVWGSRDV
jgi:hypothetical protein